MVEAVGDIPADLHMLLLVLPHRHEVGLVEQDIGGHEAGVGEQAGVDVVGVLGGLVLELGHAGQLPEHGVAVQHPAQLRVLVDVGLDEDGVLGRVQAAGDVGGDLGQGAAAELGRVLADGDGVQVGHEPVAVKLVGQLPPVLDGPQVVAQVQVSAGLDAGEEHFLFVFHIQYTPL